MRRGEVNGRLEAKFFSPSVRLELEKLRYAAFPVKQLGDLLEDIRYGTGTPPPIVPECENSRPFIRATDIKEGEIKIPGLLFIETLQPKHMAKCRLNGGELILVRSGVNTGDCAVVSPKFAGAYAAYDLILNPTSELQVEFLNLFLATGVGRLQLDIVRGRAAQPHVNAEEVSALEIVLPTLPIQRKLMAAMEKARTARRVKLAEADALLASLDRYLLDTLALSPALPDTRKVFGISLGAVTKRLDPHFHLPHFAQIDRLLAAAKARPLGSLARFSRETWEPSKHPHQTFRYLEISNVDTDTGEAAWEEVPTAEAPSRARMSVREGDIIVSLTRPHYGAIAQITAELNGCTVSTGFAVLRGVNEKELCPDYLWCVLRTQLCLQQMLQRSSGGNYPAITEAELANVAIPVPDIATQTTIATEVRRRRESARALRTKAEADWSEAKRWFEEQLLGNAK